MKTESSGGVDPKGIAKAKDTHKQTHRGGKIPDLHPLDSVFQTNKNIMQIVKQTNASISADIRKGLLHLTITHNCGKSWVGGSQYRGGGANEPKGFVYCSFFDCNQSQDDGGFFWLCAETEEEENLMFGVWYQTYTKDQEFFVCIPYLVREEAINLKVIAREQ